MSRPRRLAAVALALSIGACAMQALEAAPGPELTQPPVEVRTSKQLVEALQPGNAGRRIIAIRGVYDVDGPLLVPDGATLEGEGVMTFDADGLPVGFEPGTESTLRVARGFHGQVLTLGHGSALRGLRVLDLANSPSQPSLRQGNVVYVASRAPADAVSASIVECEITNPNAAGFSDVGPHGHGVVVLTLNPNLGATPAAHEGARISVRVQGSVIRTPSGAVVFANHFAARSDSSISLEGNRFEGFLTVGAGVSRPDAVTDSVMRVESRDNLYVRSGRDRYGWLLLGGSTSPHFLEAGIPGAARTLLQLDSTDDRVEGFRWSIHAVAARRIGGDSSPLMDNRLELRLRGTHIRSTGDGAADLVLQGALSEIAQAQGAGEFPAGDRNVLHVRMQGVTGSGPRQNAYAHVSGPSQPAHQGTGNRLEIVGDPASFARSNPDLDPPPPASFFSGATGATDPAFPGQARHP
jgi:hypothetical protein